MDDNKLIEIARIARGNAYAPLTHFSVGAALITNDGKVFSGCNIEDPAGIGEANSCAERTAVIKAMSEGEREFEAIAIVGGKEHLEEIFCTPCGVCRQYLMGFNPLMKIITIDGKDIKTFVLKDLLPFGYNETFETESNN